MITEDGKEILCEKLVCRARIKNNAWAVIKASGWFFTKDGKAYCPEHVPEWVPAWREKRRQK